MARVLMVGGGICGLAGALMLTRDGHQVTVLERDAAPVPESPEGAWEEWARDGVTQFRQAHFLAPGGRGVLEDTLPDVLDALRDAGAHRFDALGFLPPMIADQGPRADDERFVTFTARRPVMEQILGAAAEREPGLEVRRGTSVAGLITVPRAGLTHVSGRPARDGRDGGRGRLRGRHGKTITAPAVARGRGCGGDRGRSRGLGLHLLRPLFPQRRRVNTAHLCAAADADRIVLDPHPPRRQRDLGGRVRDRHRRQTAEGASSRRPLGGGSSRLPRSRPLARR